MTDGEKLAEIQRFSGLTWKDLAREVGLASPQTFTDIKNRRHAISSKLANRILERFPDIRREWLVFGEGDMTVQSNSMCVPLFDGSTTGVGGSTETVSAKAMFPEANAAMRITDNSMAEYPVGSVLILKEMAAPSLYVPGSDYVIATDGFCVVKRVQRGAEPGKLALYSTSDERYADGRLVHEPFDINVKNIKQMYAILGYVFAYTSLVNRVQ